MESLTATEALLRRDRWIVGAGLVLLCLLSWIYLFSGGGTGMNLWAMSTWQFPPTAMAPTGQTGGMMAMAMSWDGTYWLVMLIMWWVMMIAMMVPSAAPMILLFGRAYRRGHSRGQFESPLVPSAAFAGGYLIGWLVFSLAATALQWALEQAGLVHTMMMWSTSPWLSASFLIAAGIYQVTPLKNVCLDNCRSPIEFLSRHWRKGNWGALRMGLDHGLYCVGCCWFLMVLLFVGGVMNLVWIAGLAVFVLIEKLAPRGDLVGKAAGVLMLAAGGYLLLS